MRRAIVLTVVGLLGFIWAALGLAAPASAELSFCQTGPGKTCIGPINGCHIALGGNNHAFVEDGDEVVKADGSRWQCQNGKWVPVAAARAAARDYGAALGRGQLYIGPTKDDPCDISPSLCIIE